MLLTLDIGNTEITAGLFQGDALEAHWRLTTNPDRTPDEWGSAIGGFLIQAGHSPNEVTRRVPRLGRAGGDAERGRRDRHGDRLHRRRRSTPARRSRSGSTWTSRSASAPTGSSTCSPRSSSITRDTIVVDFGTATTFDCVTADAPLHRRGDHARPPHRRRPAHPAHGQAAGHRAARAAARVIGRRTEECIQAGVLFGTADAVDGIVRRIRAEWPGGGAPRVVATGGLATVVAPLTTTIEQTDPDLTLQGLRLAAGHLGLSW